MILTGERTGPEMAKKTRILGGISLDFLLRVGTHGHATGIKLALARRGGVVVRAPCYVNMQ